MERLAFTLAGFLVGCALAGAMQKRTILLEGLPWFVTDYVVEAPTLWTKSRIDAMLQSILIFDEQKGSVTFREQTCGQLKAEKISTTMLRRYQDLDLFKERGLAPHATRYRVLCPKFPFKEFVQITFRKKGISGILVPLEGAVFLFEPRLFY